MAPFRDLSLKRGLSRFAWRRKQHHHSPSALAALVDDVRARGADHVAITGDLTNFSTPEEFAAARAWLERLAPPQNVTVSPGNHDALVGAGGGDPFEAWRPWLGDDDEIVFPQVRRRGPVAIVNLCSAIPTAPHLAQGALGRDQLERLRQALGRLGAEGLCRVLLIHHPPTPEAVSRRKALRDGSELLALLKSEGAELVLHGHAHAAMVAAASGPGVAVPLLGVPSASAVGGQKEGARWHEFELRRSGRAWSIRVIAHGLSESGSVEELGRYLLGSTPGA